MRDLLASNRTLLAWLRAAVSFAGLGFVVASHGNITAIPAFIRADFAAATRDVLYGMTVIMAVAAFVALHGLRRGVQEDTPAAGAGLGDELPDEDPGADLEPAWR
jgi:uncharacterized membrane protein YidH (DUF202 family)